MIFDYAFLFNQHGKETLGFQNFTSCLKLQISRLYPYLGSIPIKGGENFVTLPYFWGNHKFIIHI